MKLTALGIALASALAAAPAMALSTFDLPDNTDPGACTQMGANANNYGNTYLCSAQGSYDDELEVKAYSAAAGANFAAANVGDYGSSGFGVQNTGEGLSASSPQHAMDNDGRQDLLLMKFDSSIALQQFKLGWYSTDSDITVLAYTGNGDAVASLTSSTEDNLLSSGWSLVGNFADNGYNTINFNGGSGAISSSYWIVSAFSKFGNSTPGWSDANDYVKLQMVAGNFTCTNSNSPDCSPGGGGGGQVSEPGSVALAGLALAGVFGVRRRRQAAAQA